MRFFIIVREHSFCSTIFVKKIEAPFSLVWYHTYSVTMAQTSTPSHCDIIDGKVDARVLKRVTKAPVEGKPRNKKGDPIFPLPYLPHCVDYSRCCQALLLNGHLFTPCLTTPSKGRRFCKPCEKSNFKYGNIEDRKKVEIGEFVQPNGKKREIMYCEFLEKRHIQKHEVLMRIQECLDPVLANLITIPEEYFSPTSHTRKRQKTREIEEEAAEDLEEIEQEIDDVFPPPKIFLEEMDSQGRTFFEYVGGYYYFDKDNKLFQVIPFANEYAEVGTWNPETKQPEIKRYSSDYESDEDDGSVSSYEEVEYTVFSHDDKKYVYNEEELIIYELLLTYDDKQKDEDELEAEAELGKEMGKWDPKSKKPIWHPSS